MQRLVPVFLPRGACLLQGDRGLQQTVGIEGDRAALRFAAIETPAGSSPLVELALFEAARRLRKAGLRNGQE